MKKALLSRDEALKDIIDSEVLLNDDAISALSELRQENALETLRNTPVSAINAEKQGLRVSALSSAGYNNIAELLHLSLSEIDSIKGIGTGTAETIKKTIDDIADTVFENTRARLSGDKKTPGTVNTVTALYKIIHTAEIRKSTAKLYSAKHRQIEAAAGKASAIGNSFFWFFSGREKKERTVNGADKLAALFSGSFSADADRLINDNEKVLSVTGERAWQDFMARPAFYFAALEDLGNRNASAGEIADLTDRIRSDVPEELADAIDQYELKLDGFKTALRSYQTFGTKYALYQEKTLLGDEMGLGKTVQSLAAIQSLANEGRTHFIVICPASVLINWVREIGTFSTLKPLLIRDAAASNNTLEWQADGGIAVVNYEALPKFRDLLPDSFVSHMTVVDEAHYIKNPEAKRTVSAKEILSHSDRILLMSGTPLENRIDEMKNLIGIINDEIAKKIQRTEDSWSGEGFRKKIAPVYLRRTREDVLTELPDLIEKDEICPVNQKEKEAYSIDKKNNDFMGMRQVSFKNVAPEDSSKLKRILELCETAGMQGRKTIVFSFFKNTLMTVKNALGEKSTDIIDGSLSSAARQAILDDFKERDAGTVLVSQIIAGGTGLNIQSASVIILCEPQIKPSLETQAVSRAYRMGQLNSVLVYRMISDDTVDEAILRMLSEKQDIFDKFADESEMAEAVNSI
ncbi:MAG: DEAD/DEAH box helicase [Lachnospiraceae bacterium]|nr:DEAD/DEAH box helicase [Lachnospiraceae bacterium]